MKNIKYGISMLLIVFVYSCNQEDKLVLSPTFDYEQIGINHNKGLDYIFESLKKQKELIKGDVQTYMSIVEVAGVEYVEASNYKISAESMDLIKEGISVSVGKFKNFSVARLSSSEDLYTQIIGDSDSLLSKVQRDYIHEILSLMENETDIDSFLVRLSIIEQNANETLILDEQPLILSVASVARYSQVYWEDNREKWLNEFGGNNNSGRIQIDWGIVAGADVASGIAMGIACTPAVAGGPVGWGFATLAIAGAAAVGSGGAIWATW